MQDNPSDDSADDPDGPPIFECACTGCGAAFTINLYFQSRVGPDSTLSVCSVCLAKMLERGRRELKRQGLLVE